MDIRIEPDKKTLGARAAAEGSQAIRAAIARDGACTIILATGASQFEMLDALVVEAGDRLVEGHGLPSRRVCRSADHPCGELPPLSQGAFRRPRCRLSAISCPSRRRADLEAEARRLNSAHRGRTHRRVLCRHWRELPSRLQRSAGRFRHRGPLHRRHARRSLPAPAARRGLVPDLRGRSGPGHLHERPPDPEERAHRPVRAGCPQGALR